MSNISNPSVSDDINKVQVNDNAKTANTNGKPVEEKAVKAKAVKQPGSPKPKAATKKEVKPKVVKAVKPKKELLVKALAGTESIADLANAAKAINKKPVEKTEIIKEAKVEIPAATAKPNVEKQAKKPAAKKASVKKEVTVKVAAPKKAAEKVATTKVTFQVRFATQAGDNLFLMGNHELLGNNSVENAIPLQYLNNEFWFAELELPLTQEPISYNYLVKYSDGTVSYDWGTDKTISAANNKKQITLVDAWNHAGFYENSFYTEPFTKVFLANKNSSAIKLPANYTHVFKVKAPLLNKDQTICVIGDTINEWNADAPVILQKNNDENWYTAYVDLSKAQFPVTYKYGVYDNAAKKIVSLENGNNRYVFDEVNENKLTVIHDGFAVLPNNTWKGAGVAIPVFSLKTEKSFGVGEFADIKTLVDWAKKTGLKLIQLLPINDTSANNDARDSYPYAAISAFALHPIYISLSKLVDDSNKDAYAKILKEQPKLNATEVLDYGAVIKIKNNFLQLCYKAQKTKTFANADYKKYFEENKHWLTPYAAFCYLKVEYGTSDFSKWPAYKTFNAKEIDKLVKEAEDAVGFYYFVQYHLHLQLKDATAYAHANGVAVKGDLPIGIYRYGADAWQEPELFHMDVQAGAPPDDFAVKGQNWGFPTYNWERMMQDGFAWWKRRFEQMSYYFDAFRIDHILGFFRIWSIPTHAIEGIMGHFVPAIPVYRNEFDEKGIWFDETRYIRPYITAHILWETFGEAQEEVKHVFFEYDGFDQYVFKDAFDTQVKVEAYFNAKGLNDHNTFIKKGLFGLLSNVIFFKGEEANTYHFRFGIESTTSFQSLEYNTQQQLKQLYVNYFFERQDAFWKKEAMQKLPALKRVTNMLTCGEDLGMVPGCVNDVMKQLGLLSLEIQRMPKDVTREFFHPSDAPYLSVVTPSTHDMSTIRGWWEEDRTKTQHFFNNELGQWGDAPYFCEPFINKLIVLQHLYSPAIFSIFQLQDLLGMDVNVRRQNPHDERINEPSDPKHFWGYRMHTTLEDLLKQNEFNEELKALVEASGRA